MRTRTVLLAVPAFATIGLLTAALPGKAAEPDMPGGGPRIQTSPALPDGRAAAKGDARQAAFTWPDGRRGAVSLSFDDARESQLDVGIPLLDSLGVRATFYVVPDRARRRLEGWRAAARRGHEIGNHTSSHPCTGNFAFSRAKALEDWTLDRISQDTAAAPVFCERELGTRPASFAYPCGQTFVGRGEEVRSYVPLVAREFRSGRLYLGEDANDPAFCDLAQLLAIGFDGLGFEQVRPLLQKAAAEGRWLVLAGHDIGTEGVQTTRVDTLSAVCRFAKDPANGLWIDTVDAVARHVQATRGNLGAPGSRR